MQTAPFRWNSVVRITRAAVLATAGLAAAPARAEVLFERAPTAEQVANYGIVGDQGGSHFPTGVTYDQARETLLKELPEWKTSKTLLKVELIRDAEDGRPFVRYVGLGEDKRLTARIDAWGKEGPAKLSAAAQVNGLKLTNSSALLDFRSYIYVEGVRLYGRLIEDYAGPDKRLSQAIILETGVRDIAPHELLRMMIQYDLRVLRAGDGNVILGEVRGTDQADRRVLIKQRLAWVTEAGVVVYLTSEGEMPPALLKAYETKFPSALPAEIDLDKTRWGRAEMELWLARMGRTAEGKGETSDELREIPYFANYLSRVNTYVCVPPADKLNRANVSTPEQQRDVYKLLSEWWAANCGATWWNEEQGKLVSRAKAAPASAPAPPSQPASTDEAPIQRTEPVSHERTGTDAARCRP